MSLMDAREVRELLHEEADNDAPIERLPVLSSIGWARLEHATFQPASRMYVYCPPAERWQMFERPLRDRYHALRSAEAAQRVGLETLLCAATTGWVPFEVGEVIAALAAEAACGGGRPANES